MGAGSWGTALASVLAAEGREVTLWARDAGLAARIDAERRNPAYLPGVSLSPAMRVTGDLGAALDGAEIAVLAVPTHGMRATAERCRPLLGDGCSVVSTAKGFETGTAATMSRVLVEVLGEAARERVAALPRPRVLALEWLDPPFAGGHWVPEMIAAAGGLDVAAAPGARSRRLSWDEVARLDPDLVVAMPCGYDAAGAAAQVAAVADRPEWHRLRAVRAGRAYPVDANGCFSRPGPRLIDGIEHLAEIFHPEAGR